jgi:hypothetical protein
MFRGQEENRRMPSFWKERARLEGILMSLAVTMVLVSRLSRNFREDLKERNGIAEIRTADWAVAWRFHIAHGTLRVARGGHPNPDYAMVYRDIPSAVRLITEGTDDAFMQGIADGAVRLDGDMAFGMWFNDLLKKLGTVVRQRMKAFPFKGFAK